MKSFVLAALTIMVGTFIANINANVPLQTHDTPPDLPTRAQAAKLFDIQLEDLAESIASDIGQIKLQVADLPEELASINSQFSVLTSRQDSFDDRLAKLESKCNSCDCSTSAPDVSAKVNSQSELLTRLLGRIEKLEGKSPLVVSSSSTAHSTVKTVKPKALIVMHTSPSCGPCRLWLRNELPRWRSVGWDFQKIDEETTDKTWPWFEVYEGEVRYEVVGPLTAESFSLAKSGKRAGILRAKNTYANHWSHPGDISQHLLVEHGVSTLGMSKESRLSLHDSIHEASKR
ncbi:MAG: hypothetical protein U0930_04825 [Pirellulales bacterium]